MRLRHIFARALGLTLLATAVHAQPVLCEDGHAGEYECSNVMLLSHIDLDVFDSDAGNDSWGWTDPESGREYAIMGLDDGTGFVDITDPSTPLYLGKLPTHTDPSVWRDIKVYADHAFVVSEANGHGMQVFDLTRLRNVSPTEAPMTFSADAHYDLIGQSHNVVINEATARAYIVGSRAPEGCAGGLHIVDISQPLSPSFAGCFAADGYTHDAQCVIYEGPDARYHDREICFASNEDTVTIVDVTDPTDTRMLSQALYPNTAYTHQGWLTEDQRFFLANDELDEMRFNFETRTLIFDVSDLENPRFVGPHFRGVPSIDHNLYVRGDIAYMANYRSGLRVVRIDDLAAGEMTNVGWFDTYPEDTATQFGGAWSNYPFFPSGNVIISDMNRGLFVVRPYREEPLALSHFRAFPVNRGALLEWRVDGTIPDLFVAERHSGDEWVDAGSLRAAAGRDLYRLLVDLPAGDHQLRLRAVDAAGLAVYSEPMHISRTDFAAAAD
jgi:choice-of-anchor B domain-containing protein